MDITITIRLEDITFSDNVKEIAVKPFVLPSYMQFIFQNNDFDTSIFKNIEKKLEHTPIKFVRRFNLPDSFFIVKSIEPDFRENVIYPALVFIEKNNGIITAEINTKHSLKNANFLRDVNKDFLYYIYENQHQITNALNKNSFFDDIKENTISFEERDELKKQMRENLHAFIFKNERKSISLEHITCFKSYYDISIENENIQDIHLSTNEDVFIEDYKIDSISYFRKNDDFYIDNLYINYKNSFKGIIKYNKEHSFSPLIISYYEDGVEYDDDSNRKFPIFQFYIYFKNNVINPKISHICHDEKYLNFGLKDYIFFKNSKLKEEYSEPKLQPTQLKLLKDLEDKHLICFLENSNNEEFSKIKNDLEINNVEDIDENLLITIKINFKNIEFFIEELRAMMDFHERINKTFQEDYKDPAGFLANIKNTINTI